MRASGATSGCSTAGETEGSLASALLSVRRTEPSVAGHPQDGLLGDAVGVVEESRGEVQGRKLLVGGLARELLLFGFGLVGKGKVR